MKKMRNEYKILTSKPKTKKPGERPKDRWEHNINIDLEEICETLWQDPVTGLHEQLKNL